MRKPNRRTVILFAALAATLHSSMVGSALADVNDNQDRTDSPAYTEARADYWRARADYAARKAATQAKKEAGASFDSDAAAGDGTEAPAAPVTAKAAATASDGIPNNSQLAALRMCESTDNYWINTGNGYYGAYQFSPVTWWWLGYSGYPNEASESVQDQAARELYGIFGWSPWPACSRSLGFR